MAGISFVTLSLGAFGIYLLVLVIYRLYLSPLAKFPGPRLAGLTRWYEFYYDVVLRGQFTFHVQALHDKYGPIVRISPEELHINDSAYWDVLYAPGRVDKYAHFEDRHNIKTCVFATPDADLHRMRRAPLTPLFSKRRIVEFQPVIQQKLDVLCRQIDGFMTSGKSIKINRAMTAFSGDVITQYVYGQSYNHLESPGFQESFYEGFLMILESGLMAIQFKWVFPLMNMLPESLVLKWQPSLYPFINFQNEVEEKLREIKSQTVQPQRDHLTILHELIDADLPPHEKSTMRLRHEAELIVAAGLLTVAWAISVAMFYIVSEPDILKRLQQELDEAFPNPHDDITLQVAEKLPYLRVVIMESVRLSYGNSARNPRIWHKPLTYRQWSIPPDTPVSMNVVDHNHNEEIFPNSHAFRPERWLEPNMDRYFYSFGKGSRSCLGINLANAELNLVLATLFRRYDFTLFETDISDVRLKHDFFLPYPKLDSQGIRVTAKCR